MITCSTLRTVIIDLTDIRKYCHQMKNKEDFPVGTAKPNREIVETGKNKQNHPARTVPKSTREIVETEKTNKTTMSEQL